jgi:hypothetical protein
MAYLLMNYAEKFNSRASNIRKRLLERSAIYRKEPDRYHYGSILGFYVRAADQVGWLDRPEVAVLRRSNTG